MTAAIAPAMRPEALDMQTSVIAGDAGSAGSLESRFLHAAADLSARYESERVRITDDIGRIDASDPVALNAMQARLGEYSVEVSMTATLARKAVGAVEALLR